MKKGPILLLMLLTTLLSLIIGIQYGKYLMVNKAQQKNKLLQDPTPSISPSPELISFTKFTNKECGFTLAVPQSVKPEQETSTSATLKNGTQTITFECRNNIHIPLNEKIATASIELNDTKISTYTKDNITRFIINHPNTNKQIMLEANKKLIPLIESSFKFIE